MYHAQPQMMYNMTVATAHTYFVGDGQWLVHNACPDDIFWGSQRKANQAARRGWLIDDVQDVMRNPALKRTDPNIINRATGNPVTYYYRSDGYYVVVDDVTGEIVQVSNTLDQNWIDEMTNDVVGQ